MGISTAGGRDCGGGIEVVGDLRLPPPEHSCTVYFGQDHSGTVYGGGADSRVKGI